MNKKSKALTYLSKVQQNFQNVELQAERINEMRSIAEGMSHPIEKEPSGTIHEYNDNKAEIVASIIDLENELADNVKKSMNKYTKVKKQIDSMPDFRYRTLLEYKFLCNKSGREIADIFKCTPRHIYKQINDALNMFESMYLE